MKASELMLNNWFVNPEGKYEKAYVVATSNGRSTINWWDGSRCKPIPLTEEILIKAGFVLRNKNANAYQHKLTTRYGYLEDGVFTFAGMYGEYRFVHELQNIFFAVYRQELPIDLC